MEKFKGIWAIIKRHLYICIFIISFLSCSNLKNRTSNPNIPYTYINGFDRYEVKPILSIIGKDSAFTNELRFQSVYSAFYTKRTMYDKFGKWDKEVRLKNEIHPILVWEKRSLFDSNNELYTIAANGKESREEIYASVIIFDSKNQDCLTKNSKIRDSLIQYFSNGIKKLKNQKKFYKVYWEMVNNYKLKNQNKN
ncbi:hypothetical protein [Aquimarina sp. 2201CG14-23]|uniref:hypothetical protein n=1 Tax=Aquimarina mycalae TaxID=3040073 RepID=UPI002477D32D|nr:hypothetical protein [Aquimarina sp. 2201CG14-23]MDH7446348.1 hypothetical protein [Aquimarina sp. 2201CG14-23]